MSPRQPPQHGGSSSGVSPPIGAVMVPQQTDDLQRPQQQYTIPGILHYIQHEWARFEMERAHWEVERAELQVSSSGRANGARCWSGWLGPPPRSPKTDIILSYKVVFNVF